MTHQRFVTTKDTKRPSGETFWLSHETMPFRTTGGSSSRMFCAVERQAQAAEHASLFAEVVDHRGINSSVVVHIDVGRDRGVAIAVDVVQIRFARQPLNRQPSEARARRSTGLLKVSSTST